MGLKYIVLFHRVRECEPRLLVERVFWCCFLSLVRVGIEALYHVADNAVVALYYTPRGPNL